jgi:Ca-activated chloride channel family protein
MPLRLGTTILFATTVATVAGLLAQQPQTFRSDVHTVAVYATVQDRTGRLVPDLTKGDFQILDNGRPVPITTFSHEILPITVALMLDMSDSMRMDYTRVRDSAAHFVDVLLPADRVRIGTFGHDVAMSPYLTSDRNILHRILKEELWISHFTALWTALDVAMDSLEHEPGRRVVLALSDGQDRCVLSVIDSGTSGCVDIRRVTKHALAGEFLIYAIGMPSEGLSPQLVALTDETGGGHFTVPRHADMSTTFERVADELHSQYLLGFSPGALDGASHKLEVKVSRHGLTARARRSYIAEAR